MASPFPETFQSLKMEEVLSSPYTDVEDYQERVSMIISDNTNMQVIRGLTYWLCMSKDIDSSRTLADLKETVLLYQVVSGDKHDFDIEPLAEAAMKGAVHQLLYKLHAIKNGYRLYGDALIKSSGSSKCVKLEFYDRDYIDDMEEGCVLFKQMVNQIAIEKGYRDYSELIFALS